MRTDKTWWEQAKNWRKWTKTCWCGRKGQNQVNKINPLPPRPRACATASFVPGCCTPTLGYYLLISANISPAAARSRVLGPTCCATSTSSRQLRSSVRSFPAKTEARRWHDSSTSHPCTTVLYVPVVCASHHAARYCSIAHLPPPSHHQTSLPLQTDIDIILLFLFVRLLHLPFANSFFIGYKFINL